MRCPVMVGRHAVAEEVRAAIAAPGVWIGVVGEAGIGKTRLVAESLLWAAAAGGAGVVGRCSAVDTGTPYRPVVEVLLQLLADRPLPTADTGLLPYAAALAPLVPQWASQGMA